MDWLAVLHPPDVDDAGIRVVSAAAGPAPRLVRVGDCSLLFSGALHEQAPGAEADTEADAERVLTAYLRAGADVFSRLRGCFAFVLDDRRHDLSYVVRDPMGAHPVFYAAQGDALYVSPNAETVARRGGRIPELNRLAAAAFLLRKSLDGGETLFAGVQRLLQGHLLERRAGALRARRYWQPTAEPEYDPDELDARLRRAVERVIVGRAGVFLSGGLDSALVGSIAAAVAHSRGEPPPVAFSLALRGSDGNEEPMQREVAARLGLELELRTPAELVGPEGLLSATLALARHPLPRPPELLAPAYEELARTADAMGVPTILSGAGGDEMFLPPSGYATNRVFALDLSALGELVRAWAGYWPGDQPLAALRGVLWYSGLRAAARDFVISSATRLDQDSGRRLVQRKAEQRMPSWFAPDEDLRAALLDHLTADALSKGHRPTIARERQEVLDGGNLSSAQELQFEMYDRSGIAGAFPLLDPDVVDLLYGLPPGAPRRRRSSKSARPRPPGPIPPGTRGHVAANRLRQRLLGGHDQERVAASMVGFERSGHTRSDRDPRSPGSRAPGCDALQPGGTRRALGRLARLECRIVVTGYRRTD